MSIKHYLFALSMVLLLFSCKKDDNTPEPSGPDPETVNNSMVISTVPAFPVGNQAVDIYFDATQGNKELNNTKQELFLYTGLLTTESANPTDWKHVKYAWDKTPTADTKLVKVNDNMYKISFTPTLFYNQPTVNNIQQIALLVRDGQGGKVARNADGSNIMIPIYQAGKLYARLESNHTEPKYPRVEFFTQPINTSVKLFALASVKSNMVLKLNGKVIAENQTDKFDVAHTFSTSGLHLFELIVEGNGQTATSQLTYLIEGTVAKVEALPVGVKNGVTQLNNKIYFTLTAPHKNNVYLLNSLNKFTPHPNFAMNKTPDGKQWWIGIDASVLGNQSIYQYFVDGLRVADPYSELLLDPNNDAYITHFPNLPVYPAAETQGIASVALQNQADYVWKSNNFQKPNKENLVLYEVLIRDFVSTRNYKTLIDSINYFKRLGVNCIELMPINEFEGNSSWGYNPSFYFAPDKYYGSKNELKAFIDLCHQNNIAVVIDMVLNHSFGQSPMVQLYWDQERNRPADNNPWFNQVPKHAYNVGYDFNHESKDTKVFVKDVLKFWLKEYRVDGFRFDLSKGFTQKSTDPNVEQWSKKDDSRIAIWKDYHQFIQTQTPNAYTILEHFAEDSEEVELAAEGMLLWNNMNGSFSDILMGKSANIDRLLYSQHGGSRFPHWVNFMESHDEERVLFRMLQQGLSRGDYNTKDLTTALSRIEMAAAFLICAPGPSMIWQFGEFGYDVSIDDGGRLGEKPLKWEYLKNSSRAKLFATIAKLNRIKTSTPYNAQQYHSQLQATAFKYLSIKSTAGHLLVIGNFGLTDQSADLSSIFEGQLTWVDQLNGGSKVFTSSTITLAPGEFYVMKN